MILMATYAILTTQALLYDRYLVALSMQPVLCRWRKVILSVVSMSPQCILAL
jgi:hypothetical protein